MEILEFLLEHLITAAFTLLEGFVIKLIKVLCNSLLELSKRVINIIPASCDYGGGNLTNSSFYRGFLFLISNFR